MYSPTISIDNEKARKSSVKKVFISVVLLVPTFLSPFNVVYSAVALPQMNLNIHDASWFGSVGIYASAFSVIIVGFLIDKCGRKIALLYTIAPGIGGWLLLYWDHSLLTTLLGQMLNGLTISSGFYPIQVYAGECLMVKDVRFRNVFMTWISLSTSVGNNSMLLLANVFNYHQICLVSSVMCAAMSVIFYLVIPESPLWLYRQGRIGDAEWSQRILGITEAPILQPPEKRAQPVVREVGHTSFGQNWPLITRSDVYKPTIILSVAAMMLCLCGDFCVNSYLINVINNTVPGATNSSSARADHRVAATITGSAGTAAAAATNTGVEFTQDTRLLASYRLSLYSGLFMCVGSLASVHVLPRLGLRKILISSKFILILAFLALTYGSVVEPLGNIIVRVLGVTIIAFTAGLTIGPRLSYVGDIFPVDAKGFASAPALANVLTGATVNKIFPYLRAELGGYVYCIFAGICLLCAVYIHFFIPEVVGRTLEDINEEYNRTYSRPTDDTAKQ